MSNDRPDIITGKELHAMEFDDPDYPRVEHRDGHEYLVFFPGAHGLQLDSRPTTLLWIVAHVTAKKRTQCGHEIVPIDGALIHRMVVRASRAMGFPLGGYEYDHS